MKNKLSDSKNSLHGLNNRLDTLKGNISEFEDSMLKLRHGEKKKLKQKQTQSHSSVELY